MSSSLKYCFVSNFIGQASYTLMHSELLEHPLSVEEIRGVSTSGGYFRSRPQGEAMSVSFQLLIEDYNDLNTLEQCNLIFITTNREQKSLFLLWRWSEFLLSSMPLIKTGVYHNDPVWWQIVGGSQWSIMNSFYTIVYIIFNNYIIKLKRQLW